MKLIKDQVKKFIFLDRDGIINIDYGYTHKIDNFVFKSEIFHILENFLDRNYEIIILTNQSGIGRGYYGEDEYEFLTNWMLKEFSKRKIKITDVFHCPHSPDDNCLCRKPRIGLYEKASEIYKIDKEKSWSIGDNERDIIASINFGIENTILVNQSANADKSSSKIVLKSLVELQNLIDHGEF